MTVNLKGKVLLIHAMILISIDIQRKTHHLVMCLQINHNIVFVLHTIGLTPLKLYPTCVYPYYIPYLSNVPNSV